MPTQGGCGLRTVSASCSGSQPMGENARVTFLDDRIRALLGVPPEEDWRGREYWLAHIHPEDLPHVFQASQKVMEGSSDRLAIEYRYLHPSGGLVWLHHLSTVQARDASGRVTCLVGVVRDITERKRAEHDLLQRSNELAHLTRVSAVAQLASSLAHELNQPLGAILRNAEAAELLLADPSPDLDEVRAILADIHSDDHRAGEVIDRLRAFMRRGETERRRLDVGLLAGEGIALVHPDADRRGVRLALKAQHGLPLVHGDRVQLQQVLLNLLLNALDALSGRPPGKGSVTVRVSLVGTAVEVRVSDDGPGIPANGLTHVFEPFFTSKPNGLGMGLPIARGIVEAHGGQLWATNNPEGGATFVFSLPVAAEGAAGGQ